MKLKQKAEAGIRQIVKRKPLSVIQQRRLWARALVARDFLLRLPAIIHNLDVRIESLEEESEMSGSSTLIEELMPEEMPESKKDWKAREDRVIRGIEQTVERQIREASGLKK